MTSRSLAQSYLSKAQVRLKALAVLRDEDAGRAYEEAAWIVALAGEVIGRLPSA